MIFIGVRTMRKHVLVGLAVVAVIVVLGSTFTAAQEIVKEEAASSRTGISGPIEQGDFGFYRAAFVPVSGAGISGPAEHGDLAIYRAPYLPVGKYGVSGPVEQGDAGF